MPSVRITAAVLAASLLTAPLFAHARLMATTPAANSTGQSPGKVEMRFSRTLVAKSTTATVERTDAPGKPVAGKTSVAADGKTLVVALASPLPHGAYTVTWHIQTTDQHRMQGRFAFAVK